MGINVAPSLFDDRGGSSFGAATDWLTGTLLGSVAVSLCVLSVAFVGLMLLSGRLSARAGLRVVLGCFVLLGAQPIAIGLSGAATQAAGGAPPPIPATLVAP